MHHRTVPFRASRIPGYRAAAPAMSGVALGAPSAPVIVEHVGVPMPENGLRDAAV
jgi:hypothetical protein